MNTYIGKVGFRFKSSIVRPNQAVIQQLAPYSTCNISDGAHKLYTMNASIKPLGRSGKICGPAVTVELPLGDNLMLHKALSLVQPGDILVVDMHGSMGYSACGGIMLKRMKQLGVQGIVVDGCVRDLEDLEKIALPVYAKGLIPIGGAKEGPGQINYPICCGNVVVQPGDIIVGDNNGVVCIAQADVAGVVQGIEKKLQAERKAQQEIAAGILVKPEIDAILMHKKIMEVEKI